MTWTALIVLALVGSVALSYLIEALRKAPETPAIPPWAPEGARQDFLDIDGLRLRRVVMGKGRPILLLHTLRTQMDLFRDVASKLAEEAEVHLLDFPAHGYSEIDGGEYGPDRFIRAARGYLDAADLTNTVILGESIGGAVGLTLAAEKNPRLAGVVAVNSYDYGQGKGILRGSFLSWLIFTLTRIPVLGATVWRYRWPGIFKLVIKGSVHNADNLPAEIVEEMHHVGNRPGHYRAFISLILNFPGWEDLRKAYGDIEIPVRLVYGEHDWSTRTERRAAAKLIPHAEQEEVAGSGHLMSFDAPEAVIAAARAGLAN